MQLPAHARMAGFGDRIQGTGWGWGCEGHAREGFDGTEELGGLAARGGELGALRSLAVQHLRRYEVMWGPCGETGVQHLEDRRGYEGP